MKKLSSTIIAILFVTVSFAQKTYTLDKNHAKVGFSVSHFVISNVEGNFKVFDATLNATKDDFSDAVFTFTADVNSIDTDIEKRDNDLRSSNFFDVAKFPTIDFKSTSFRKI